MTGKWQRAAFVAVGAVAVLTGGSLLAADSIDEIMKANHGKKAGLAPKLAPLVKAMEWDKAGPIAKEMATNAAGLSKLKPEKGDAKSWEKLSNSYYENLKATSDAIDKKDAKAANAAFGKVGGSCKSCHDAHRG